jgi:nanoRNase/pAp phosphatase (c-di-AMP/oligoRNAs hydrolase)
VYLHDTYAEYVESVNATWALEWAGKIDSARYSSPEEYFKCDNPWLVLRLLTDHDKQAHRTSRIAELLAANDMDAEIVVDIMGGAVKAIEKFQADIGLVKSAIVENNGVGIIITKHRNDFPRYSEYIMRPDINFSIRVTNTEHGKREIRVGCNIWKPKTNINIGKIMNDLFPNNGGGHPGIGGAIVEENEYDSALDKIWAELIKG